MKTDAQMNAEQAARIRDRMENEGDRHLRELSHKLTDDQLLRLKFLVTDPRMTLDDLIGR